MEEKLTKAIIGWAAAANAERAARNHLAGLMLEAGLNDIFFVLRWAELTSHDEEARKAAASLLKRSELWLDLS